MATSKKFLHSPWEICMLENVCTTHSPPPPPPPPPHLIMYLKFVSSAKFACVHIPL
jgi:hypothetical protein